LTLSRDLLQTDEASGSLDMMGRTLAEMVGPDSALLLLCGDRQHIVRRRAVRCEGRTDPVALRVAGRPANVCPEA